MRRLLIAAALALVVVGCGGSGTGPQTQSPTAAAPSAAAPATPEASEDAIEKVSEILIPFQDKGSAYAEALVVVEVKNTGTGWVELLASESDWTIYDGSGGVVTTGGFLYAYPTYLAPGATGYFADHAVIEGVKAKTFKRVETDGRYAPVDADAAVVLSTSKAKNRRDSGEMITSGIITNTSSEDVQSAHVAAFYLDAKGKLLGFSSTNSVENLGAGKSKGFATLGELAFKGKVAKTIVLAGPD